MDEIESFHTVTDNTESSGKECPEVQIKQSAVIDSDSNYVELLPEVEKDGKITDNTTFIEKSSCTFVGIKSQSDNVNKPEKNQSENFTLNIDSKPVTENDVMGVNLAVLSQDDSSNRSARSSCNVDEQTSFQDIESSIYRKEDECTINTETCDSETSPEVQLVERKCEIDDTSSTQIADSVDATLNDSSHEIELECPDISNFLDKKDDTLANPNSVESLKSNLTVLDTNIETLTIIHERIEENALIDTKDVENSVQSLSSNPSKIEDLSSNDGKEIGDPDEISRDASCTLPVDSDLPVTEIPERVVVDHSPSLKISKTAELVGNGSNEVSEPQTSAQQEHMPENAPEAMDVDIPTSTDSENLEEGVHNDSSEVQSALRESNTLESDPDALDTDASASLNEDNLSKESEQSLLPPCDTSEYTTQENATGNVVKNLPSTQVIEDTLQKDTELTTTDVIDMEVQDSVIENSFKASEPMLSHVDLSSSTNETMDIDVSSCHTCPPTEEVESSESVSGQTPPKDKVYLEESCALRPVSEPKLTDNTAEFINTNDDVSISSSNVSQDSAQNSQQLFGDVSTNSAINQVEETLDSLDEGIEHVKIVSIENVESDRDSGSNESPLKPTFVQVSKSIGGLMDRDAADVSTGQVSLSSRGAEVEQKSSAVTQTVVNLQDFVDAEGDPDVCILPDDSCVTATVDQQRPKRAAARAADNMIKSLVVRTLEPVGLAQVDDPKLQLCSHCKRTKPCHYTYGGRALCSEVCHAELVRLAAESSPRTCAQCRGSVPPSGLLSWQTMDFCKDDCLAEYQIALGAKCINCQIPVPSLSLGKFCVRFGSDIKQFCSPSCLEVFKKEIKVCSYCQKDISSGVDAFFVPMGDKGQLKEFCTQYCMGQYMAMGGNGPPAIAACAVCGDVKPVTVEVMQAAKIHTLCSEPCFAAFKFVNNISEGRCSQCRKYFNKVEGDSVTAFINDEPFQFCCKTCFNVYIFSHRKIVACGFCKVRKYNIDMIRKTELEGPLFVCSLVCLKKCVGGWQGPCDQCGVSCVAQCKAPVNGRACFFCSYKCAATYKQGEEAPQLPREETVMQLQSLCNVPTPQVYQHIVTKPPMPKDVRNKSILCKPYMHNKGTSCRPMPCHKSTETDSSLNMQVIVPVPVPIYIPAPMHMYSLPYPVPIPFPLPVPVPMFIPTTRNSAKGIMKEIKKIQEKIPADPYEAELLMMAEIVAGDKKQEATDSESEGEGDDRHDAGDAGDTFSPEAVDTSNAFGEDIMQIALKMASELDEPAVDMESVLTSNTITPTTQPTVDTKALYSGVAAVPEETAHSIAMMRGRKRTMRGSRGGSQQNKRGRRSSGSDHGMPTMSSMGNMAHIPPPEPQRIEVEKPDANMRLKYTFGVNAWRHWVMQKNIELEKAMLSNRKIKPFKPDLLQLTADELNFSLCLFVKEVKKPNGQEYAPDTIYYLCLGIQQYLFENGRIDNIFTDSYYEKFTDCLDEVAKKFAVLYNDSQYIVTRVEEEHLWESKQLGAHSPHVLLSTLMFFNTKHFNLVTVEEHMQLSFSHIMKHWKRSPNSPGVAKVPGSRNVLLRFYPPQSALEGNSRKKKVYEQQENEENPLRCPVKLYEFYLSKCPESVKTRNDVFYLLPERSCVPDSPVWYSTMALGKEPLMKMLHRVKMVKEINIALLSN